ncbi:MAG: agmatinase [Candidatus Aenigmatarchaeota archaeon]
MKISFGGIETEPEKSKIWVFGVPFDGTSSYRKGARNGPEAIRKASSETEVYDIETGKEIFSRPGIFDDGDIAVEDSKDVRSSVKKKVQDIISKGKVPLMLGGEHIITAGAVEAIKDKFGDVAVVSFDAHGDLRDKWYDEGLDMSKDSHACVMRRVIEIVGKENLIELGVREVSKEEMEQFKTVMITSLEIKKNLEEVKKMLESFVKNKNVYLSVDIDAFDVPGTGTPQPGGIDYYDFLELVSSIKNTKKIVGLDLTEVAPVQDSNYTEAFAAKLIFQTIAILETKI